MANKKFLKAKLDREKDRLNDMVMGEYLGLGDLSKVEVVNPFDYRTTEDIENPHIHILKLMRNPKYFSFTCKEILNIELAPFQLVILEELWNRKYPMLVASRGASKSFTLAVYAVLRALLNQGCKIIIVGAAFRQAKVIFEYIESIWHNAPVLRDLVGTSGRSGPRRDIDRCTCIIGDSTIIALPLGDGCLKSDTTIMLRQEGFKEIRDCKNGIEVYGNGKFNFSDEHYNNGFVETKVVTTKKGFSYEGTPNHKMKVLRGNQITWVRTDEMVIGDRILVDRSSRWHQADCSFITEEDAHALGCLVGDGSWSSKNRILYASKDKELVDSVTSLICKLGSKLKWCGEKDDCHYTSYSPESFKLFLSKYEIVGERSINKEFPKTILRCSKSKTAAFISGLYDTDGHLQVQTAKGGLGITIGFTNTSERLVNQLQNILLHFGILSTKTSRQRPENENWNRVYELLITGQNVKKFAEQINFKLSRKRLILEAAIASKKKWSTNDDEVPGAKELMLEVIGSSRIKKGFGSKISESVAISKIKQRKVITRDLINKFIDAYTDSSHPNLLTLKELCNNNIYYDTIATIRDSKCETYDIHVPITHEYCANGFFSHNTKIRGQRANYIIADEFASIPRDIYENVVSGFAAVSSSPVDSMKNSARIRVLKSLGMWNPEHDKEDNGYGNQAILAGTAYYDFNHFADYWKQYKNIILSKGDKKKLQEIFKGEVPEKFDWRRYSIIRFPVELLPQGFMDEAHVARSKATVHSGIYNMEFGACFATDSNGFFKRSLIESCVTRNPIELPISGAVKFHASLRGNPKKQYIFGVDPASEQDNFSIVVLEVNEDHIRIVYCWTTTRQNYKEKLKDGMAEDTDFYGYCARKIRDLMKIFPCLRIVMDSQGGGVAVEEALQDSNRLKHGEEPIWQIIEDDDEKPSDDYPGKHILEMIQFADAEYTRKANHGMRKDFEDKVLLFPFFDPLSIQFAIEDDKRFDRKYDTLEDCVMEIEELKDELATIVHTQTIPSGRDRWDTPEVKLPGNKKGRLRKDRYSALLIANMAARTIQRTPAQVEYKPVGGIVGENLNQYGALYSSGPAWFLQGANQSFSYGKVVTKR